MSIFDKIRRLWSDEDDMMPNDGGLSQSTDEQMPADESIQTDDKPIQTDDESTSENDDLQDQTTSSTVQQAPEYTEAEMDKLLTDLRFKAVRRMMPYPRLREWDGKPLSLETYLDRKHNISAKDIANMHIVVDDPMGKRMIEVSNPQDYELMHEIQPSDFLSLIKMPHNDFNYTFHGKRNVTLDMTFKGEAKAQGTSRLILNISSAGCSEVFERVNIFLLAKISYLSFKDSGTERGVHFLTHDKPYSQQLIDRIAAITHSAYEKSRTGQSLTDQERLIMGEPRLQDELRRAEGMMRRQEWSDAIAVLAMVYDSLRQQLLRKDTERAKEMMLQTVMALYKCHMALEHYDMALFYGELSAWLEGHPNRLFVDALSKTGDIRFLAFPPQPDNSSPKDIEGAGPKGRKRFSLILDTLYGVRPSDLSSMLIVKDGKIDQAETITDPTEIWSFDMLARMRDCESLTAHISLRTSASSGNSETTDKSTETAYNVIIATFTKETVNSRPCVKMSLMIPEPILGDDHSFDTVRGVDLLFTTEKVLDMPLFHDIREEAAKKARNNEPLTDIEFMALGDLTEARYNMVLGANASKHGIWGDVIYYLTKSYRLMAWSARLGAPDDNAEEAIYNLCYMLGYAYCELKLYPLAISYLSRIAHYPHITYQIEYINALCNSSDIRAIDVINNRLDTYPEKLEGQPAAQVNAFFKFLKRRYAYMLIECEHILQAREYLQKLLEDDQKETRQFAQSELDYLNQKYPQNGVS